MIYVCVWSVQVGRGGGAGAAEPPGLTQGYAHLISWALHALGAAFTPLMLHVAPQRAQQHTAYEWARNHHSWLAYVEGVYEHGAVCLLMIVTSWRASIIAVVDLTGCVCAIGQSVSSESLVFATLAAFSPDPKIVCTLTGGGGGNGGGAVPAGGPIMT